MFPNELKAQVLGQLVREEGELSEEQFNELARDETTDKIRLMEVGARTKPDMRARHNQAVLNLNNLGESLAAITAAQEVTLEQLQLLGFEVRRGSEVRGRKLITAWDKYKVNHPDNNFRDFLVSNIPPLNAEELIKDDVCITLAKGVIAVDQSVIMFIPDLMATIITTAANYREAPRLEEPVQIPVPVRLEEDPLLEVPLE